MTERSHTTLPGDICPPWCDQRHRVDREPKTHAEDRGVFHEGGFLDSWKPANATVPLEIWLRGFRHDSDEDWPDSVRAEHTDPGSVGGVDLEADDAQRLGEALVYGAAILRAGQDLRLAPNGGCPRWCVDTGDHQYHAAAPGSELWPTTRPSACNTHGLSIDVFPTEATSDGTPADITLLLQYREAGAGGAVEEVDAALTPREALALAQHLIRGALAAMEVRA